jgi:hypothetical protein
MNFLAKFNEEQVTFFKLSLIVLRQEKSHPHSFPTSNTFFDLVNIYDDVTVVLLLGGISFILKRKRERGL